MQELRTLAVKGDRGSTRATPRVCLFVVAKLVGQLLLLRCGHCVSVKLRYTSSGVTGQSLPDEVNLTLVTESSPATNIRLSYVHIEVGDIHVDTLAVGDDGAYAHQRVKVVFRQNGQVVVEGSPYSLAPIKLRKRGAQLDSSSFDFDVYNLEPIKPPEPRLPLDSVAKSDKFPFPNDRSDESNDSSLFNKARSGESSDDASPNEGSPHRRVHRSPTLYQIEVVGFADFSCYQRYLERANGDDAKAVQELSEFVAFVIFEVDQIYKSITSTTFQVGVNLIKVVIAKDANASPMTEPHRQKDSPWDTLMIEQAITDLGKYVTGLGRDLFGPYDHVMLFSGCNFASTAATGVSKDIAGLAPVRSCCKENGESVSAIEVIYEYLAILIAAHELGHNLGCLHDGEGNTCLGQERYVMSASTSSVTATTEQNPWKFSPCSVKDMEEFLTTQGNPQMAECLTQRLVVNDTVPNITGRIMGQEVSIDVQCQRVYGPTSSLCRSASPVAGICVTMFCKKTTGLCAKQDVAPGTTCGDGKLCVKGQCQSHPNAKKVDGSCVYGDTPGIVHENLTCAQSMVNGSYLCYDNTFRETCCDSCQGVYRAVRGCEYGDKSPTCTSAHCVNGSPNLATCCGTCNHSEPLSISSSPGSDQSSEPAMHPDTGNNSDVTEVAGPLEVCTNHLSTCDLLIARSHGHCSVADVQTSCCLACLRIKDADCRDGEKDPALCNSLTPCHSLRGLCCRRCGSLGGRGRVLLASKISALLMSLVVALCLH